MKVFGPSEAVSKGLANEGDVLVARRKIAGRKLVKDKHAEDVWTLVSCTRRADLILRALL